jgi:hypothetical protein
MTGRGKAEVGLPSQRRVAYFTATVSKTRRTRGAGDVSCLRRADHEHFIRPWWHSVLIPVTRDLLCARR